MIYHGKKTVTTAGAAVPLTATRFPCAMVTIQPLPTNTGVVYVGGRAVSAPTTPTTAIPADQGLAISPGDFAVAFPAGPPGMYDLNQIYIDASVNGEGVQFIAAR